MNEDAIDRKLVYAFIAGLISDGAEREKGLEYISNMPPVNPTKTGHWIEHKNNGMAYIECSECSSWFLRMYLTRNSYCPNCGVRMVEPQESEDDEQIKVGTKVRTIKDKDFAGEEVFPVETIGIVEEIRKGGKLPYIIRANSDYWYYSRDMFEVIEDIEPQERSDNE